MYLEIIILQVINTNTCSFHQKALSKHRFVQERQGRRPPNQAKLGRAPRGTDPCLAHSPPRKGGGEMAWSWTDQS
jgi:hypothetical protein